MGSGTASTTVAGSGAAATTVAACSARIASKDRNGTAGGSKLDGAGAIGSGLSGGSCVPIRPTATGAAAPLANSYIRIFSLSGRRKETGFVRRNGVTMGGRARPGVPQVGESANRWFPARPLRKAETAGGITASGRSRP